MRSLTVFESNLKHYHVQNCNPEISSNHTSFCPRLWATPVRQIQAKTKDVARLDYAIQPPILAKLIEARNKACQKGYRQTINIHSNHSNISMHPTHRIRSLSL